MALTPPSPDPQNQVGANVGNSNAPIPLASLPANIAGMIPNPAAPPLSLLQQGLTTPSQVVMNMLNRISGSPLVPTGNPPAIQSFWQGIGRQGSALEDVTPKKRSQDLY